ncbi:uncharacterized protein LOC62_06G008048 [Vanrija pseudolonga]|uniref:Uncharacterized protein n=1 Tax=Vanrija pseudolonga TaxID=143232 RepID=A0AAF0YGS2_9TREE|nr:hypothetical protein LOC62_06G008048 [Vanrija pseudolonga]
MPRLPSDLVSTSDVKPRAPVRSSAKHGTDTLKAEVSTTKPGDSGDGVLHLMGLDDVTVVLSHHLALATVGTEHDVANLCGLCVSLGPNGLREAVTALAATELVQPTPAQMTALEVFM